MLSSGLLEIWLSATLKYLTEPRASRIKKKKKKKEKEKEGIGEGNPKKYIYAIRHQVLFKGSQIQIKDLILVCSNIYHSSLQNFFIIL